MLEFHPRWRRNQLSLGAGPDWRQLPWSRLLLLGALFITAASPPVAAPVAAQTPRSASGSPSAAASGQPVFESHRSGSAGSARARPNLSLEDRRAAEKLTMTVGASEWLGPLAPVALSPFFGITCLSGLAIFGEDWLPAGHTLTRVSGPLRNPAVFVAFLILTLATSVPRLSKVSKPLAQSVDRLEAYAGIITLLVVRYLGNVSLGIEDAAAVEVVYQAGVLEFSAETLLSLVTILNVLIINAVKFFFEVMVWITPVPLIDAAFEAANKSVCLGLMGIYAYSPLIATVVNFAILAVCALAFLWIRRREVYYRTIIFECLSSLFRPSASNAEPQVLTVFPESAVGVVPALARCQFAFDTADETWTLTCQRLFRSPLVHRFSRHEAKPRIETGLVRNRIVLNETCCCVFGRRHQHRMDEIALGLQAELKGTPDTTVPGTEFSTS